MASAVMTMRKMLTAVLILTLTLAGVTFAVYTGAMTPYLLASEKPAEPVLLFTIGVHIEPFNGQGRNSADYNQEEFFNHHVEDIRILASMVEKYGGRLSVQAQSPFTLMIIQSKETLFTELEAHGHEIALHFHEDAHLGANPENLSVEAWTDAMLQEISFLKQAGATSVRYWSGGNLYPGVLDGAALSGLSVMSDWKNPHTQETDTLVVGVNPWRPSGGPSESSLVAFAKHDPQGRVVYLPDGLYDPEGFASKRLMLEKGGDQAYFDFIRASLEQSLDASRADRVNVFHFTIHPGEFRGDSAHPYSIVDSFLAGVVNPLVLSGRVRWATFSEMADAFAEWEKTHPGVDPHSGGVSAGQASEVERDVTYCTADGVQLKMDIYYPGIDEKPQPVLVYVHGGGWTKGDKGAGAGSLDIRELAKRGYFVAAINYRLAPQYKFPAQIEDVKCAVRFLRASASMYGIDAERIGAWGGSAGGHLVSLLGVTDTSAGLEGSGGYADESSRVQAVVDLFGPADLTQVFSGANPQILQQVFGVVGSDAEILRRASPVTYVTSDDPPFLIMHGEKDTLVPLSQSQELYDVLVAAHVPATLVVVKNAGHGFAPAGGRTSPSRVEITKMIADFFDQHIRQADVRSQDSFTESPLTVFVNPSVQLATPQAEPVYVSTSEAGRVTVSQSFATELTLRQ